MDAEQVRTLLRAFIHDLHPNDPAPALPIESALDDAGVDSMSLVNLLFKLRAGRAAAAALIQQEMALIRSIFLDETQRARAISLYGVVLGLGVIFGLAGGGLLVHWDLAGLGWRSAFLINVPIGVAIVLLGRVATEESRSARVPGLDLVGAALTAVALPVLLRPIVLGQERDVPAWIWLSAVLGVAVVAVLARQQRAVSTRGAEPLFPPHVLWKDYGGGRSLERRTGRTSLHPGYVTARSYGWTGRTATSSVVEVPRPVTRLTRGGPSGPRLKVLTAVSMGWSGDSSSTRAREKATASRRDSVSPKSS